MRDNKLRFLEQRNRGITAFAHWVTENKARFKGDVYGPILLEVTVADQQHAKYLEQQLPGGCLLLNAHSASCNVESEITNVQPARAGCLVVSDCSKTFYCRHL